MEQQTQSFYTEAPNLTIVCTKPKRMIQDGMATVVPGDEIAFTQMGQEKFGVFHTNDPDRIAFLQKRMLEVGDVFDVAEYNRRSVPPDKRAKMAEEQVQSQTLEINRLRAMLEARNK